MMDIKELLILWIINFSIKKPLVMVSKMELKKMKNWLKSYINQSFENLLKEKYIHH